MTPRRTASSRRCCARRLVRWWPGSRAGSATSTSPRRRCSRRWSRRSPRWRRDGPPDNPGRVAPGRRPAQRARRRTPEHAAARARRARGPARPSRVRARTTGWRCCSPAATPALAPEARLALTLRAVVGLTTPQIARAFLVNESTLAQRIVRAKRKIVDAGISLAVPPPDQLTERLGDVLAVVYVMFNEGFVSSTGATQDRDLAADAVWLAGVVATAVPDEPEAWGLAALLTIQHARAAARFDEHGGLVLLRHQDRSRWDHAAIAEGERLIERAARAAAARPLPAPGRDRRPARDGAVVGGDRLAPDRDAVRRAGAASTPRPWSGSTRPWPGPSWASRPPRWPSSTGSAGRAGVVPPLPRGPRRAAHHARPPRRGPRGQPHRPRADHQRRRAPAAHHPAAPAPARRTGRRRAPTGGDITCELGG